MIEDRPIRSMSAGERLTFLFLGALRALVPILLVAFAFLLMTVPFFPPLALAPNFGLTLVFLFALYRPAQLPVWTSMPLGAFADLLLGMPFGANALLLPLFMLAVIFIDTKTSRVHWLADWLIFLPFTLGYYFLLWQLCLFAGPYVPFSSFLTQGAATVAIFPLAAFLFVSVQRKFVDRLNR